MVLAVGFRIGDTISDDGVIEGIAKEHRSSLSLCFSIHFLPYTRVNKHCVLLYQHSSMKHVWAESTELVGHNVRITNT